MTSLNAIPFEDLEIEYITVLKGFIQPVLFPFGTVGQGRRFLYVGGDDHVYNVFVEQFPEEEVRRMEVHEVLSAEPGRETASFDYIAAVGIKSAGVEIFSIVERLVSFLKPGGIMVCGVYGVAGYYGLDMLGTIIKRLAADMGDLAAPKNISKLKKIVHAVLERLPVDHPAYHRRAFMERLKQGDSETIRDLLTISAANIFTVTQVLERILAIGAGFMDWVIPAFYDPARSIEKQQKQRKQEKQYPVGMLEGLAEPFRWQVAEMVNAAPPEHYFFVGRAGVQPFKFRLESDDIYLWRPMRLPLYSWENLEDLVSGGGELRPVKECEALGTVALQSWQARLYQEAEGVETLNGLSINIKRPAGEVIAFLKRAVEMRVLAMLPPGGH